MCADNVCEALLFAQWGSKGASRFYKVHLWALVLGQISSCEHLLLHAKNTMLQANWWNRGEIEVMTLKA